MGQLKALFEGWHRKARAALTPPSPALVTGIWVAFLSGYQLGDIDSTHPRHSAAFRPL
jgi:hypothetical protein